MSNRDIPLLIKSASTSSERRITPSWTITQLKQKLEPVTGIPPTSQKVVLNLPSGQKIPIEADDEGTVQLARWDLIPYAEIEVCSFTRIGFEGVGRRRRKMYLFGLVSDCCGIALLGL